MYLQELDINLSIDRLRAIENSIPFKIFLRKFWVHGLKEYHNHLEEAEKVVCIVEYFKYSHIFS